MNLLVFYVSFVGQKPRNRPLSNLSTSMCFAGILLITPVVSTVTPLTVSGTV